MGVAGRHRRRSRWPGLGWMVVSRLCFTERQSARKPLPELSKDGSVRPEIPAYGLVNVQSSTAWLAVVEAPVEPVKPM